MATFNVCFYGEPDILSTPIKVAGVHGDWVVRDLENAVTMEAGKSSSLDVFDIYRTVMLSNGVNTVFKPNGLKLDRTKKLKYYTGLLHEGATFYIQRSRTVSSCLLRWCHR